MSKNSFNLNLESCVDGIQNFLSDENIEYSSVGSSFAINIPDTSISFIRTNIESIIRNTFKVKKKKVVNSYKYNYFENKLYIQFKRYIH